MIKIKTFGSSFHNERQTKKNCQLTIPILEDSKESSKNKTIKTIYKK